MSLLNWIVITTLAGGAPMAMAESQAWEDPSVPRLEIRQYRFSHHAGGGYDRLVLEFERKNSGNGTEPRVTASRDGAEATVRVDNALLLGAIPETLINDSYRNKAKYLGALSVGMDSPKTGFSLQVAMKPNAARIKASWLASPPRLVIDAYGRGGDITHVDRRAMSVSHRSHHPTLNDLMCFPADAKVGLTVIFKPRNQTGEELQNIRVNTDGSTPTEAVPGADAIVCYPKNAQIMAALSFEDRGPGMLSQQSKSQNIFAPVSPAAPVPKGAAPVQGNENDLDPGPFSMPAGLGQLPGQAGTRQPAENAQGGNAPDPLSILPPLN